jgi:hypothetical protein
LKRRGYELLGTSTEWRDVRSYSWRKLDVFIYSNAERSSEMTKKKRMTQPEWKENTLIDPMFSEMGVDEYLLPCDLFERELDKLNMRVRIESE